jgi:DNA polymerase-3 subunit gamma/tau
VVAAPAESKPPVDAVTGRAALGGRARTAPPVVEDAPSAVADAPPPSERTTAASTAASTADITADVWENTIRPALRGMARAVYAPASFVRSTDSTLTLSVPNAVHCAKCEEQRSVVEAALAEYTGAPVTVELLDGGGGGGGSGQPRVSSAPSRPPIEDSGHGDDAGGERTSPRERGLATAAAMAESGTVDDEPVISVADLPDDDDVDLDDLIDAPPESVKSPIDRLAEAFPGSELIDEAG